MFLSIVKFFRGFLLVRLIGYSPERFLNLCSNHNILIWNLSNNDGAYEFYVSIDGFKKLKPLLRKTKTRLIIKKKIGFPFFLYRYRKRKLFFIGIFFCVGFLVYLTTFVWLIDINGNLSVTDDTLLRFLKKENAAFGTPKRNIDCEKLEEELRSEYEEIIWASVRLDGTKLTVDIQENLVAGQKKENKLTGAYDIVADKNAVITSIVTRKGSPNVKKGDTVKKGDLLVGSRLEIYNDSSELAKAIYVTADADIFGQTAYTYQESFPLRYAKKTAAGEVKHCYELQIFSWKIGLSAEKYKKNPYTAYTNEKQFKIAKDYYIPVILRDTAYYPCEYRQVTMGKEAAKAEVQKKVSQFLKKLTEKGIQITGKNVMIEFKEGICCFKADISAEERIGRFQAADTKKGIEDERLTENESD